jgi:hypothetical protein
MTGKWDTRSPQELPTASCSRSAHAEQGAYASVHTVPYSLNGQSARVDGGEHADVLVLPTARETT